MGKFTNHSGSDSGSGMKRGTASAGVSRRPERSHDSGAAEGTRPHIIRIHARVSGLVQGVGFRYFAVQSARRLGVTGWVRNRLDGDVEAEAQGPRAQVDAFVAALHEGPRWSHVDAVDVTEIPPRSDGLMFAVRR